MATSTTSRLTYAPILLGIAFIATLFLVAESGYKRIHQASQVISAAEERQALMSRYVELVLDAESAQRGFLLSEDPRYLRGFDPAVRALDPLLDDLVAKLQASGLDEDAARAQNLRSVTGRKVGEMQVSLRLYGEVGPSAALQLMSTDIGAKAMADLRGSSCSGSYAMAATRSTIFALMRGSWPTGSCGSVTKSRYCRLM